MHALVRPLGRGRAMLMAIILALAAMMGVGGVVAAQPAHALTLTPIFNNSTNGTTFETIDSLEGYSQVKPGGVDSYGTAWYKTFNQCAKFKFGSGGTYQLGKNGWNYTGGKWTYVVFFNC